MFPRVLSAFYNEIYIHFDKYIKVLRSDSTLEYTQSSMASFCIGHDIIKSVVFTLISKMVYECKYRHLLDVAQTVMFNMHVFKQYWAGAILTACYLINRMPSSVVTVQSRGLGRRLSGH